MELKSDIDGRSIRLRTLRESDVGPAYVRWMNDPEVVRYTESRFTTHTPDGLRRYVAGMRDDPNSLFLAIVLRAGERHIGNIKLGPIDWNHGAGDIGLVIGEKDCWGKGYATEAIGTLASHAFASLGLATLSAGVYAPNVGCIKAFERAGFTRESVQRARCRLGDERVDVVLLGRVRTAVAQ